MKQTPELHLRFAMIFLVIAALDLVLGTRRVASDPGNWEGWIAIVSGVGFIIVSVSLFVRFYRSRL